MKKLIQMVLASLIILSVAVSLSGDEIKFNQSRFNITHLLIDIEVDPNEKHIAGFVETQLWPLDDSLDKIVFDLHDNFTVSAVYHNDHPVNFQHQNDNVTITLKNAMVMGRPGDIRVVYSGKPHEAENPPWDAGFVWSSDKDGKPWVGVACQGLGPYVWFPTKNELTDEPDSVDLVITVPEGLFCASNGILADSYPDGPGKTAFHWKTRYPTNNYNISINIGNYEAVRTLYKNKMDLVYYVLPQEREGADGLIAEAAEMIAFYEKYFGEYPFAKEKFGLVQTKYWGMEHQTINSYGNSYKKTKLGYDFLMLHEMSHEWWGNLLSVDTWKDAWIHEGIGTYTEGLWIEDKYGHENYLDFFRNRASRYIKNKVPVVPEKPAEDGGFDSDVYYKGAYVIHTLRYLTGRDTIIKILNESLHRPKTRKYNHISTEEWTAIAEEVSGKELSWFFNVYLYQKDLPVLKVKKTKHSNSTVYSVSWQQEEFTMPLEAVWYDGKTEIKRQRLPMSKDPVMISAKNGQLVRFDPDRWILFEEVEIR